MKHEITFDVDNAKHALAVEFFTGTGIRIEPDEYKVVIGRNDANELIAIKLVSKEDK